MADQPVLEDAADGFHPGRGVVLTCRKSVDRLKLGTPYTNVHPVAIDGWASS